MMNSVNTQENSILSQQAEHYGKYLKIVGNPRYRKAWKFIEDTLPKESKLLDIGCTDGEFSKPLIEKGYECFGLEFMDEAIAESTAKGIKVTKGSFLEKFPFEDNSFDVVFGGEVIEHTTDDDAFVKEIHRVLKPGGYVILTTPNLVSLGNRLLMSLGKMPRFAFAEFHYRMYTAAHLVHKVERNGFTLQKLESSYVLISTVFNALIGRFGEALGTFFPTLGEHLILYAKKK